MIILLGQRQIIMEEADDNRWMEPPRLYPSASGRGFLFVSADSMSSGNKKVTYHQPPWQKTVAIDVEQLQVDRIAGWNEDEQIMQVFLLFLSSSYYYSN